MTRRGFEERRRVREERQRRAVEAVVALACENGLRVEEPTVLNDLFSHDRYLRQHHLWRHPRLARASITTTPEK